MTLRARFAPLALTVAVVAAGAGGCIYSSTEKERVVTAPAAPAAPTPVVVAQTPPDRVVTYPEGRWTLYGNGTTASPHYWVWVPTGSTPPPPPPIPAR